jgi:hypothetical protein
MADYKFKLTKQTELVIAAGSIDEAWQEIIKVDPDLLGLEWAIEAVPLKEDKPIDQGPVELDDFGGDWDLGRGLGL